MDRNEAQKEKSEQLVAGPREQRYGHPKVNYKRIALIWSAVLGIDVTPTQAVLCELGVKFSRLVQSPDDDDTQVDIHGYLSVLQRLLDPEDLPGTSTNCKVSYKKPIPEAPATLTDGKVYVDGELWGYMKNGIFKVQQPKTSPAWEPGPTEELLAKKAELYDSGSREYGSGTIHPDGSVEGTLDEALASMPNRYVLPIKNGLRLLDNPTLGNIQYAQSLHPGSSVKWNMDGTVDIIFANFFAKEGNPCGQ